MDGLVQTDSIGFVVDSSRAERKSVWDRVSVKQACANEPWLSELYAWSPNLCQG